MHSTIQISNYSHSDILCYFLIYKFRLYIIVNINLNYAATVLIYICKDKLATDDRADVINLA